MNNQSKNICKDDFNPEFIFQCVATELLVKALNGDIDLLELAKKEMANRGLDNNGKWINK